MADDRLEILMLPTSQAIALDTATRLVDESGRGEVVGAVVFLIDRHGYLHIAERWVPPAQAAVEKISRLVREQLEAKDGG